MASPDLYCSEDMETPNSVVKHNSPVQQNSASPDLFCYENIDTPNPAVKHHSPTQEDRASADLFCYENIDSPNPAVKPHSSVQETMASPDLFCSEDMETPNSAVKLNSPVRQNRASPDLFCYENIDTSIPAVKHHSPTQEDRASADLFCYENIDSPNPAVKPHSSVQEKRARTDLFCSENTETSKLTTEYNSPFTQFPTFLDLFLADDVEAPMAIVNGNPGDRRPTLISLESIHAHLHKLGFPLKTYLQRLNSDDDLSRARFCALEILLKVYHGTHFEPETLITSVNLFDLFLSRSDSKMMIDTIPLWALTCFIVASKIIETNPLSLEQWCVKFSHRKEELMHYERELVKDLHWDFQIPTVFNFLDYLKRKMNLHLNEDPTLKIIKTLQDKQFLQFLPHEVAVALMLVDCSNPVHITEEIFYQVDKDNVNHCAGMILGQR